MTNVTRVQLAVDSSQVRRGNTELSNMQRSGQRAESSVAQLGRRLFAIGAAALSIRAVVQQFQAIREEGELLERNMLRAEQLVRATGAAAGFTAEQLHQQARQQAAVTLASTEEVMQAQGVLLTYRNVAGDTFRSATEAAADMAAVFGGDLATNTRRLGRLLEDPMNNMDALSRQGINFADDFKETIEALWESGRAAEAQDMILQRLAETMGGAATAEADGLSGAQDGFAQAVQEARQQLNETLGITDRATAAYRRLSSVVNEFTAQLASGQLATRIRAFAEPFREVAEQVANMFGPAFQHIGAEIDSFYIWAASLIGVEVEGWMDLQKQWVNFVIDSLKNLPRNFADFVRLATVEILSLVDRAEAYGTAIAGYLDPRTWFSEDRRSQIASQLEGDLELVNMVRDDSIAAILAEREAREDATNSIIEQSERKREAWEAEQALIAENANVAVDGLDRVKESAEGVGDAFGVIGDNIETATGALDQSLRSMQNMFEQGSKGYQELEVAIQAVNAVQAINAVLNQGQGDPYTSFARMAAMAAAVASLGYSVGNLGGGSFSDTAQQRQDAQGTGTVLGMMDQKTESIANATERTADATSELVGINRSMLSALESVQDGITAVATGTARRAGQNNLDARGHVRDTAFSNILTTMDPIGGHLFDEYLRNSADQLTVKIVDFVDDLIGGSSKITDEGVRILGGTLGELMEDVIVDAYQEAETKRYAWSSTRTRTAFESLGPEVAEQFSMIFESIADSVFHGATALGLAADDVEQQIMDFEIATQMISLRGLDAEEQEAEIRAVFSQIFDNLAGDVVPFADDFRRIGEGLGETLARLGTNAMVVEEAALRLGFQAEHLGAEQFALLSTQLVDFAGGIGELIGNMGSFIDRFASDEHKFDLARQDLERGLERVGIDTIPETRDAMWELMESLDAGTEAGREQIAALLELTNTSDEFYKHLEQSERELMMERQRRLDEARADAIDSVTEISRQLNNELTGISAGLDRLRNNFEPGRAGRRDSAVDMLRTSLLTGDLAGTGEAARLAAEIDSAAFSTAADLRREQARTIVLLEAVEREGLEQVSVAEQSLDALREIDEGIDDIADILESVARRLTFAGGSLEVPEFAGGGRHIGGLRIVGENGPELESTGPSQIARNNDLQRALAANAELLAELREVKQYMRQTTKNTGEARDKLNRWNREGLPEEREQV